MSIISNIGVRLLSVFVVFLAIPIGLFARSKRSDADPSTLSGFFASYTGDTLWPIMFFFIGRFFFTKANRWLLASIVLLFTSTLEFGQLWKPPALQWMRDQPVLGFILGNTFIWSDVACLITGTFLAVTIDTLLVRNQIAP